MEWLLPVLLINSTNSSTSVISLIISFHSCMLLQATLALSISCTFIEISML